MTQRFQNLFLMALQGEARVLRLLVDTGFTGKSSFILSDDASDLIRAEAPPAQTTGALQGEQNRAWVTCRIPELGVEHTLIAIMTDLSVLSYIMCHKPSPIDRLCQIKFALRGMVQNRAA